MPTQFQLNIPTTDGPNATFGVNVGQVLYLLGANGVGKSSLVSLLFNQHSAHSKRISAHRQTWFESNALNITPQGRHELEGTLQSQDTQARSRYWEWNAAGRSGAAIFDLIDATITQDRKIVELLRNGHEAAAKTESQRPSPIEVINELMRLSSLPIEISVEEGQKIVARKNGGSPYSVAELSDGERNAFLIGASILTAKAETLIIIDEPERHLHRSIISPLLKLLFVRRKDCAFIVSTHELMLPVDTPEASTLLVRGCEYQGQQVRGWTLDMLPAGAAIDEGLKRDVLGARRKMLFVEGTAQSLDLPLYGLLFPQVSVIPKEGCRDVEYAVRGLRGAADAHWIAAWGIVDNDQRSPEDIARLQAAGVWALSHYSVESLYYHPTILARVAARQAQITGADADALVRSAIERAIAAVRLQKEHLVSSAVLRSARDRISSAFPKREDIARGESLRVEVDISALRSEEELRFDRLVDAVDWDGLLTRYPLRESAAFDRVVSGITMADQPIYRAAVLKLLQEDATSLTDLRGLLGDLYASVIA
jgi:ABC-type cobalamin/Fe3+-siderophores transport system ATPase subunit